MGDTKTAWLSWSAPWLGAAWVWVAEIGLDGGPEIVIDDADEEPADEAIQRTIEAIRKVESAIEEARKRRRTRRARQLKDELERLKRELQRLQSPPPPSEIFDDEDFVPA